MLFRSEVKEILADYEAHFEEGKKEGLTEEEISKELGSPKDIYDSNNKAVEEPCLEVFISSSP